jgi:arginase
MKTLPLFFPQWQGSGLTDEVRVGAQTLSEWFDTVRMVAAPLSDKSLRTKKGIMGYDSLVEQWQSVRQLLDQEQPDRILAILGDCGAEVAPVAYLNQRYDGNLLVLWLDAHADLNTPESSPSSHFHGMPVRLLIDGAFDKTDFVLETCLNPEQVLLAGLRETDPSEADFIREENMLVVSVEEITTGRLMQELTRLTPENLYIHLDLDVLEPTVFTALKCPSPDGITPNVVADLIQQLITTFTVVGLSLTETIATSPTEICPIEPILSIYNQWLSN